MKVFKVLMVWILSVLPLAVKVLKSEGQILEKTVTETSTELTPSLGKYELIHDSPHLLSTESGIS